MDKRWHILILANQPHDAALLEEELRKVPEEMDFEQVNSRESFLREMDAFLPDLVVAEHSLRSFDGMAVLSVVRIHSPGVPVIIVSDEKGEEDAVEAVKNGAADYLTRENLYMLSSKARAIFQQVEERQVGRVHSRVLSAVRGYEIHEMEHQTGQSEDTDWMQRRLDQLERDFSAAVLDTIGALVMVIDREGKIIGFNRAGEKTTGYRIEEVRNRYFWDIFPRSEEREMARKGFSALLKGESSNVHEDFWLTKKGERRLMAWTNTVIRDDHGEPDFVIATGIDVTEQRRTEIALRENEQRLRAILDAAVDGIITIDEKGSMASANSAAQRIFGYTEQEMIGNNVKMLMPDPYFSEHDMYLSNYMRTGIRKIIGIGREVVGKRKNGSVFPMELAVSEVRLNDSRLFTGLVRDISVRKAAQTALNESQERLRLATEAADMGAWQLDWKSGELILSEKSRDLFGLRRDDDSSFESLLNRIHPEDRSSVSEAIARGLEAGEDYNMEYRIICPDGSTRWILARGRGVNGGSGGLRDRMIGVAIDITARKHSEEKLREAALDLERSNKDLEQFAYIVSHDLQEPLRMVRGYLQLLGKKYKDTFDQDARDFMHFAVDGAARMQEMIADLLAFSRVGTRGEAFREANAEEILEQVLADLQMMIEQKKAVVGHDPLPVVVADKAQFARLLQNLISNGLKFSKEGRPPEVYVGAHLQGDEWKFFVRDNGIGINPKYFDRIFVIFERLHGRDSAYPGTGIGLAICKKIVERHGGRIWLESQLDEGTTFFFSLPKPKAY